MNTPAIHQAIRLSKYPNEMAWLASTDADFPEGMTDLLRLCASQRKMENFAEENQLTVVNVQHILINYIEQVLLIESNSDERVLGLNTISDPELITLHHKLLTKIYSEKSSNDLPSSKQSTRINTAYLNIKRLLSSSLTTSSDNALYKNITLSQVPLNQSQKLNNEQSLMNFKAMAFSFLGLAVLALFLLVNLNVKTIKSFEVNADNNPILSSHDQVFTINTSSTNPFSNQITMASSEQIKRHSSNSQVLQKALRQLEYYYENGIIEKIRPILVNSPGMQGQSNEQLQAKLKTLFQITQDRKMLLYDFNWIGTSGRILGNGQFLSRYRMSNEAEWKTRKGSATIVVDKQPTYLKIISLNLTNTN